MEKIIKSQQPVIQIEPAGGGVNFFVPLDSDALEHRSYQELLIRAHEALLAYLVVTATAQLPVIA